MTKVRVRTVLAIFLAVHTASAGVTYRVTENPEACHDVHLGGWMSVPPGVIAQNVETGNCRYEFRGGEETLLYVTGVCKARTVWLPAPQKYSVDLSHSYRVRRISDAAWEAAPPLPWSSGGIQPLAGQNGVQYRGPVLERSAPKWAGEGYSQPIRAPLNSSMNRMAVNSWDGINEVHSFMNPASFGLRDKVKGQYWIDIYDTASGERLVKIEGSFKGVGPYVFQGHEAWYGDRYFVMPLGRGLDGSASMSLQRLLICDVNSAGRNDKTRLKERK